VDILLKPKLNENVCSNPDLLTAFKGLDGLLTVPTLFCPILRRLLKNTKTGTYFALPKTASMKVRII
jgi:hypothetical protein